MEKVSLEVSLVFSAAPEKAFAIQRAQITAESQTPSHTSSFLSPKRCSQVHAVAAMM